jgi:glutathione S-transferase
MSASTPGATGRCRPGAPPAQLPLLWHLKVSNFNEKVRWALDYKRVPHRRRAAVPGLHRWIAARLTGGRTFPILVIDGRAVGNSSEIIDALERRQPDPSLYGRDAHDREQALQIERLLDEQLGPSARLLFLHHTLPDAELFLGAFAPDLSPARARAGRLLYPLMRRGVVRGFGIDERSVARARATISSLGRRLCLQRRPSGYLVGDTFTVADLTLASLLAPLVAPPEFPYPQPQRGHPALASLRRELCEAKLLEWTAELYARHRRGAAQA